MFVSDEKALKYHLNQKQEVDLEKEYGIEHLVDSLEGDFYTFDMFYQRQEHYQTMVEIFKEDLIINDHGGMGSCDCSTIEFDKTYQTYKNLLLKNPQDVQYHIPFLNQHLVFDLNDILKLYHH